MTPFLKLPIVVALLGLAGCGYDGTINPRPNHESLVALDDLSCVALVAHNTPPIHVKEFIPPDFKQQHPNWEQMFEHELPPSFKALYEREKKEGKFIPISSPARTKTLHGVYSENGEVKQAPKRPYTLLDERKRNVIKGVWVLIASGPLEGRTVCADPRDINTRWEAP